MFKKRLYKNLIFTGNLQGVEKTLISKVKRKKLCFLVFIVGEKNVLCVKIFCNITEKTKQMNKQRHFSANIFFNWDSFHARLNRHYEPWSYKKKEAQKDQNIQKIILERTYSQKVSVNTRLKAI